MEIIKGYNWLIRIQSGKQIETSSKILNIH